MIDLHIHSRASDGTDDIPELLEKIKATGIDTFSITDHDTIEGARDMETEVSPDMTFIRGIEFSAITEVGKCHILGYGMDWNKRAFRNAIELGANKRAAKLERRLEYLKEEFGIDIPERELAMLRVHNSAGKPHLANVLVSMGIAPDRSTAIEKYINPCRTETDRLDGAMVINAILESGGVPVWAHPLGGTGERERTKEEFEKQLDILVKAGIMGLECYYSKYDKQQIEMLVSYAKENNLLISGGSDYHGKNKSVCLGELNADQITVTKGMLTVLEKVLENSNNVDRPMLEIIEGADPGAYFHIMPVKVLNIEERTDVMDNQEEMRENMISVEEDVISDFLYLIFRRHFDNNLPENAGRDVEYAPEHYKSGIAFEWYLTDNFYTLDGMRGVIEDIRQISKQLEDDPEHESLDFMRKGLLELAHYYRPGKERLPLKMSEKDISIRVKDNIPHLIDFYGRFCGYMEDMIRAARNNGYNTISVCGP